MSSKDTLIVFDLDYTLWPFWVDTHVDPPFHKTVRGDIVDTRGRKIKYYPEVPEILETLHQQGYLLGVASRTSEIEGANQLLKLFGWKKYFHYKEIYPGCKLTHFIKLKNDSGLEFNKMIFFDDEHRNIKDVGQLGVTSILVSNGMDSNILQRGLEEYKYREKDQ